MKKKVTCRSPVDLISKQNVIVNVQFIKEQKLKIVWCFLFINNKYESNVQFLLQKRKVKVILDKLSKQRAKVLIVQFSRTECERCFSSCIENKKWKFYRVKGLKLQQSRIMVRSKIHWQRISPYHGFGKKKFPWKCSRIVAKNLPIYFWTCCCCFGDSLFISCPPQPCLWSFIINANSSSSNFSNMLIIVMTTISAFTAMILWVLRPGSCTIKGAFLPNFGSKSDILG